MLNGRKMTQYQISIVSHDAVQCNVLKVSLRVPEVLGSEAVAVTFANRLYGRMAWIIPIFVACSTFGAVNGQLLTSSRLFFSGAREGQMPVALTMISISRTTPMPSVVVISALSLAYLTSRYIRII